MQFVLELIIEMNSNPELSGSTKKTQVLDALVEHHIEEVDRPLYDAVIDLIFEVARNKTIVRFLQKEQISLCRRLTG